MLNLKETSNNFNNIMETVDIVSYNENINHDRKPFA